MFRHPTVALLGLVLFAGGLRAAEITGKLKSVQPDKNLLVLDVDGNEREFTVPDKAVMEVQDIAPYVPKDRLKDQAFTVKGRTVRVTTEKKDEAEVVTKVVIYTGRKK